MVDLPCNKGEECDAPCCGAMGAWDEPSFRRAEEMGLIKKFNGRPVEVEGKKQAYFMILPNTLTFRKAKHKMTEKEVDKLVADVDRYMRLRLKIIKCIFLGKDNRCRIYGIRPEPCRAFGLEERSSCPRINCFA